MNYIYNKFTRMVFFLGIISFGFTQSPPPECGSEGEVDPENSFYGNRDMHEGGCWTPPEPITCVYCEYM